MSGIVAVFARDGTVDESAFDAVFDALAHRGRDGADAVVRDRVALGHHHLYTTPEEVGEDQPVEFDDLWLTMDGRVDNREAVLAGLADAGEDPDEGISDAELVLRGYRAWGDGVLDRLVGAFGFALWDGADERLLVARDKTGIFRDAYYADVGDAVVVASEMNAVLEHPAVSSDLNEPMVGEALVGRFMTPRETFYADVRDVGSGSLLSVTADGSREESYWEPWNVDVERDGSMDAAEEFLDRLEEAVACRLRGQQLPGFMLSGGLDSTTLTCVAHRYLDRTRGVEEGDLGSYTLTLDDDFFEGERERMEAVVDQCGLESHTLSAPEHYTLKDVEFYEEVSRESPVYNAIIGANGKLFELAAEEGERVLLAGIGGNAYDGNRFHYLELLQSGRIVTFLRHLYADPVSTRRLLLWFVLVPASDRIAEFVSGRHQDQIDSDVPEWFADDFLDRTGLEDRLDEELETGFSSIAHELMFKFYYHTGRRFEDAAKRREGLRAGVDLRCPFLDSRLLSFLFSVPSWETFADGEDKALVRKSMEGILPEVVRTQEAAVHFSSVTTKGVRHERREYVEDLLADPVLAELGIVDGDAFAEYMREAIDEGEFVTVDVRQRLSVELWLRQRTALREPQRAEPSG